MLENNLDLDKNMKSINPETSFIKEIDELVSLAIVHYKELVDVFDMDSTRLGLKASDLTHGIRTAIFGSAPEYDKNHKKVVGLLQGSYFTTTDALRSKTMSNLHGLVAIASSKIAETFQTENNIVENASEKYYDAMGRSSLQRMTIGSADDYHRIFYETDNNNKISPEFRFKNP